jgi:hypothetical protein
MVGADYETSCTALTHEIADYTIAFGKAPVVHQ